MHRAYNSFLLGLFLFFVICPFSAQAAMLGFVTEDVSETDKAAVLDRMDLDTVQDDSYRAGIQCFAVDQNGRYALAVGKGSNCRIYVYDHSGKFQYGCSFRSEGTFGIEFCEKKLLLHFNRGDTVLFIDESGKCVDVQKADDPIQHGIFIKEIRNQTTKIIGEKIYSLERNLNIGDSYSRFVIDENGKRMVLYDVTSDHIVKQVMLVASPICFFTFVFYGLAEKQNKKEKTSDMESTLPPRTTD